MRYIFFFFQAFFHLAYLSAQKQFIISGRTNLVRNGKVVLLKNAPDEFYSIKIEVDTVNVIDSRFLFKGYIRYPQQFRVFFPETEEKFITEPFFLDTGFQKITIDSNGKINNILDVGYSAVIEGSQANLEYKEKYLPLFESNNIELNAFFLRLDSCEKIIDQQMKKNCLRDSEGERLVLRKVRDSLFFTYVIHHETSVINSWLLYEAIRKNGYKEIYENIFTNIKKYQLPAIDNSLSELLNKRKNISVGSKFPLIDFINSKVSKNYLSTNQYTLIEFWFSGCRPCISHFNLLRNVYEKYSKRGFAIVAISTDKPETVTLYKKILKRNNYPWKQILDISGKGSSIISINKYPTSFLLDQTGKIISIDMKTDALDDFLKVKL